MSLFLCFRGFPLFIAVLTYVPMCGSFLHYNYFGVPNTNVEKKKEKQIVLVPCIAAHKHKLLPPYITFNAIYVHIITCYRLAKAGNSSN